MIQTLIATEQGKTRMAETIHRAQEGEMVWVLADGESRDRIAELQQAFGLHDVDIERMTREGGISSNLVMNREHTSFTLHYPCKQKQSGYLKTDIVLGVGFLIVFSPTVIPSIKEISRQMNIDRALGNGVEFALYRVLLAFVEAFSSLSEPILTASEEVLSGLDQNDEMFAKIRLIRRSAGIVLRHLRPQMNIITMLSVHAFAFLDPQKQAYFTDVADLLQSLADDLEAVRDNLLEAVEGYTSIQSNKMNKVMKMLTIISTIFLPATLVASIYGMNFHIPEYSWQYGYAYSLLLMVAIAVVTLLIMRKKGWF